MSTSQLPLRCILLITTLAAALFWHQSAFAATVFVDAGNCDPSGTPAYCTIQAAIDGAATGSVIEVASGTYNENITINKTLTLQSTSGLAQTTIQGTTNGALGTVLVTNNTTGVVINGFTIEGIDNPSPGIESAALYFQGNHSNAQILNNKINANGDLALLTEFGATISGFTIDNNIFAGQTFTGQPAGQGTSQQFTLANVPRQLVVISGGSGGGNTSNITFTDNNITGITGGLNSSSQEQGNTLVTIDANGATISGNTFAGTTTLFGISLRSRGPNTTITSNTFSSTGMGATTAHLLTLNHPVDLETVVAANTFDRGAFADLANGTVYTLINPAIAAAAAGQTVLALPGVYNENITYSNPVSLIGSGSGSATACGVGNPATDTIIRATTGDLLHLSASGAASNNKLLISDLRLELQASTGGQRGIYVNVNVANIALDGIAIIGNAPTLLNVQTGLLVRREASITNWDILNSSFNCLFVGAWFDLSNATSAGTLADNITILNGHFRNNGIKGLYAEKLSNATIQGNEFIENNKFIDQSILGAAHGAGLDINLKFGTYSNINILNNTFTGNGIAAREGGALLIKARDDGTTYGALPATLDTVTIANNVITENERGIRLGEPNQANAGPTQVTINNNTILSNIKTYTDANGSTYGGVVDWTASPTVDVVRNALYDNTDWNIAETNGGTVDGTCNWYNTVAGPGTSVANTVTATPWLVSSDLNGPCVLGSIQVTVAVVGSTSFAPATWELSGDLGNFTFPTAGGSQAFLNLDAGSYTLTQTVDSDYDTVIDCGNGAQAGPSTTLNLLMAQNAVCTFTNTLKPATLTVTKIVINNHGGTATVADFPLFVNGSPVTSGQSVSLNPGTYTVTENGSSNYLGTISGDCAVNGSITLNPGESKSCTITNDDLVQGTINLTKVVVGNNAFAPAAGWQFSAAGISVTLPAAGGNQLITNIAPGTYTISEVVDSDYFTEVNCGAGSTLGNSVQTTLALGQITNCIFTNTVKSATLTVTKTVVNDDGGTATVQDFPLFVSGSPITSGHTLTRTPGTYIVSETNIGGYAATFSGDCASNGVITLNPGDAKSCTITNNDIAVNVPTAAIYLVKTVNVVPDVCGTEVVIPVISGETVYYCYTITNNGNISLTQHTLVDNQLGTLIDGLETVIRPGQSVSTVGLDIEISDEISTDTTNIGTWTAVATKEALIATATAIATVTVGIEDYEVTINGTYLPPAGGGTVGGKMLYNINVLNTGTALLQNLQLTFIVPTGTTFAGGAAGWSCATGSPAGTICTYNIDLLKPGEDLDLALNFDIVAQIDINNLALQLTVESEGTPISPTSLTGIIVYGPNATIRDAIFLPQLDR